MTQGVCGVWGWAAAALPLHQQLLLRVGCQPGLCHGPCSPTTHPPALQWEVCGLAGLQPFWAAVGMHVLLQSLDGWGPPLVHAQAAFCRFDSAWKAAVLGMRLACAACELLVLVPSGLDVPAVASVAVEQQLWLPVVVSARGWLHSFHSLGQCCRPVTGACVGLVTVQLPAGSLHTMCLFAWQYVSLELG